MKNYSQLNSVNFKIFVTEKQSLIRIGICSVINNEEDLEVVGESDSVDALLKYSGGVDLFVIDSEAMSDDFLFKLKKAKENISSLRILITTFDAGIETQLKFFKLGVSGVFVKYSEGGLFIKAVKAILSDDLWFERKILNSLANDHRIVEVKNNCSMQNKLVTLTSREKCIVCYAVQGLPAKRIAQKLSVQEKTVRNQLTSIYQKLEVSGQVELCLKASELSSIMPSN